VTRTRQEADLKTIATRRHDIPSPLKRTLQVVVPYVILGALWILLSDGLLDKWFDEPRVLTHAQTVKGWVFVAITGLALGFWTYHLFYRDAALRTGQDTHRDQIRELSEFRQSIIESADIWISVLDLHANILVWNRAAERITGFAATEALGNLGLWPQLFPDAEYRRELLEQVSEVHDGRRTLEGYETVLRTRNGKRRVISWNVRPLLNGEGRIIGTLCLGLDVTRRREAEKALRKSEHQLSTLLDNLPGMAYRCQYDEFWTMKFVSSGCRELTGYEPEALIDNRDIPYVRLIEDEDNDKIVPAIEEAIALAEPFSLEYRLVRADGRSVWVWERGRAVHHEEGMFLEGIILDISEVKQLQHDLREMAIRDPLTGLINRREMNRLMQEEQVRARRYNRNFALLWIDLDNFKTVNDRFGHSAGDKLLRLVSDCLGASIRKIDVLARLGGEEFLVLLPEMNETQAVESAERLRRIVEELAISDSETGTIATTASLGVAVFPQHGTSIEQLCRSADHAMYAAKERGRNQVCLADPVRETLSS